MYDLVVENYTADILEIRPTDSDNGVAVVNSFAQYTFGFKKLKNRTFYVGVPDVAQAKNPHDEEENSTTSICIKVKRRWRYGWRMIKSSVISPYTIFSIRVSTKSQRLIIFPKRELSSFLSDMPSTLPLSSLLLPGTHNCVAFYGWPVSQCQDIETPLAAQFALGIRVIDVRLSIINGSLISYHGLFPERLPFRDIIEAVYKFLISPEGRTETIVVSIKQEDVGWELFSKLVHDEVCSAPWGKDFWFLENRIPTLGEVRGKAVLFSRFGGDGRGWEGGLEGIGIHPPSWPDSKEDGFYWWSQGTQIKVQDWYAIPSFLSIPEKAEKAAKALTSKSSTPVLSISFLSAASFPLALPQTVACGFGWPEWNLGVEGVNSRVAKWILSLYATSDVAKSEKESFRLQEAGPRLRGWCLMDFFTKPLDLGLINLLIECNYRGRTAGEEGWTIP